MKNLETEVKKFDFKEWIPLVGFYVVPKNLSNGTSNLSPYLGMLNAVYHGTIVSVPIGLLIYNYLSK